MAPPIVPKTASPEQVAAALTRLCEREFLAPHETAGVLAAGLLTANQSTTGLLVAGQPDKRSDDADPRVQQGLVEHQQAETGSPEEPPAMTVEPGSAEPRGA